MKITKIVTQKYRKQYRSIFLDGNYAFKLHEEVIEKNKISEGLEIDADKIEELKLLSAKKEALEYGYLCISYKSRSEKEMHERLRRKGFSHDVINFAIKEFKNQKLIDDVELAKNFSETRLKNSFWGTRRIRQELIRKGIDPIIAEEIPSKIEAESEGEIPNEEERAYQILLKRRGQIKPLDSHTLYRRLYGYLARRGFSFDTVDKALNRYKREKG